jgi:hypothetical protein
MMSDEAGNIFVGYIINSYLGSFSRQYSPGGGEGKVFWGYSGSFNSKKEGLK